MTPADWPNNEWLGKDSVLLPLPTNEGEKVKLDKEISIGNVKSKASWFNYIPGKN